MVAPDESGTPGTPRVFLTGPGQGINIAMNTWHGVLTPLEADADWWMLGPYQHQIEVGGHLLLPLGSGFVPRQRWGILGGPGTLPTLPTGFLGGDHLVLIRASYLAELRRIQLPLVGPPALRFEYAAGTAWAGGDDRPPLEQSVGGGVQLLVFNGMVYVDPASSGFDPIFRFGAQLPAGGAAPF